MDDWKRCEDTSLFMNVGALIASDVANTYAGCIAGDIALAVWLPTMTPFEWDESRILALIQRARPGEGYTAERLRRSMSSVRSLLTVLADGRWTVNPRYFRGMS